MPKSDASLSGSSVPQGLFRPPGFISIWIFCSTGIISVAQIHLYLALLLHRDYFNHPDSSLSGSFSPQGLLCPGLMHLHLALLLHRDYFGRPDSSLSGSFSPQGLFRSPGFISIWLFFSTGIIPAVRIHLHLTLLSQRDYFGRPDSSLSGFFAPQGLFQPSGFISIWLFCSTGIISTARIHLYLAFLFHRDYFGRPDSSLSGSFAPQGLFRPPGFISIWFFCATGIISAARIHLYLAFLFHKDYFGLPDSSLSGFSVSQGLFRSPGFISI